MIEVDWNVFLQRYLTKKEVFVVETDDSWEFYCSSDIWKIKCVVEKWAEQSENIIFLERYFAGRPNVIRVKDIGEPNEPTEEEIVPEPIEEVVLNEELMEAEDDITEG